METRCTKGERKGEQEEGVMIKSLVHMILDHRMILDDQRLCMDDDHDACQGLDAQDERRNLWFEISFRGPS